MSVPVRRARAAAVMLGLFASLAAFGPLGCAGEAPPRDSFYDLTPADSGRRFGEPLLNGTLLVERFTADGVLSERPILYKNADGSGWRQYAYHYWMQAPGTMLRDAVIREYRRANVAERVISPAQRALPAYRLTGSITRLYHERRSTGAAAIMVMEIAVTRARDGEPLLLKTYRRSSRLETVKLGPAIAAFQRGLTDILAQSMDDLATSVRASR